MGDVVYSFVESFIKHTPEWFVALFTLTLWWSTRRLWRVTRDTLKHTKETTEIIQRAYLSVRAGGIRDTTDGPLLAHVNFKNVGHLPASDFRWTIRLTPNDDGDWVPPQIPDGDLRQAGVLPIATSIKRGSPGVAVPSERFLYAWGRVTYLDGFGNRRFANFCHRYNTAVRETPPGGGYLIDKKHARHHDHGNEAN
jgi:hypothetical protein